MTRKTVTAPGRPAGRESSTQARAGLPSPVGRVMSPADEDASLPLPGDDGVGSIVDDEWPQPFGAARLGIP